jgi:hypothetical protein
MTTTTLQDDATVKTNQRSLVWLLATAITLSVAGGIGWASVKTKAENVESRVGALETTVKTDHDVLVRTDTRLNDIDKKLDRVLEKLEKGR